MGEMADYYIEQSIERMGRFTDLLKKPREIVWHTKDGKCLKPHEMESTHLMNCLHLTERRQMAMLGNGKSGIWALNNAPTYRRMVSVLVSRGKLTWDYTKLSILDRLKVTIAE